MLSPFYQRNKWSEVSERGSPTSNFTTVGPSSSPPFRAPASESRRCWKPEGGCCDENHASGPEGGKVLNLLIPVRLVRRT